MVGGERAPAAESAPLDIRRALRGERLFITGATGFIGKVLVEKLLWSVPEVAKLLLLVRSKAEQTADLRLREEVLDSPIMARLRALHGEDWESWAASKIQVVAGNLGQDRFGLDSATYARLSGAVDRVVACAATVTFDEELGRALELNARGALRTLELARDAGEVPLLHVSTCFVSGRCRTLVTERVRAPQPRGSADPDSEAMLAALDESCVEAAGSSRSRVAAGAELAARYGFHDVYTLTKALGERLIERHRGRVPVALVRPAIVESAAAEPIPGWIDGVRVADPLLVAYGRGLSRDFPGAPGARLDIVPVDQVVNATIAALSRLRRAEATLKSRPEMRVYQVSSARNPITLEEFVRHARDGFTRLPLRDEDGKPINPRQARFMVPELYHRWLLARRRRLRRLARLARWSRLSSLGRRLTTADRTLGHFIRLFEVYRPYVDHGASYEDTATRELWKRMSAADRLAFPFDIATLDWPSYIAGVHVRGLQRFALRAESGAPPPPRPHDPIAAAHARGDFPAAMASTVYQLFATAATADPGAVAFQTCRRGRWLRYTYGQALTAIANIASRLEQRHGIRHGDRVVLWGSASPEWVLTSFAVHRLGAVTVPLDPQWPAEEIEQAARFTGAKLICAAPELSADRRDHGLPAVSLRAPFVPEPDVGLLPGVESAAPDSSAECAAQPDDLASILFTSGTTVEPKAVPLTHRNLLANVRDLVPVMQSSRQRLLSVLPIHHVFEFTVGLLVPLVGGGTISYVPELKPAEIRWMMNATRPTMLVAVPRLLELLHSGIRQSVAAGGPMLGLLFRVLFALSRLTGGRAGPLLFGKVHRRFGGALRRIATGGSALEPSLGKTFRLMGFQVAEGYGMTETSPVLTVNPWNATRFGSVGRPLPGVEIQLRPVAGAANGAGQLWVRGANVMSGYYRNEEASREALANGWLNTGDIGTFDRHGYLHIAGRTKDVIVTSAGKNVYPEEVEHRYRGLDGVEELVVLGLANGGGGESVAAVIVPAPEATPADLERIHSALAARSAEVPSYQQISRVEIWRGDLPKTTTLKIQRGKLREAILAAAAGQRATSPEPTARVPAATTNGAPTLTVDESWVVTTLARLARSRPDHVLAANRLGELGVDSLTRVELLAEIEGHFDLRIDDESAGALHRVQDLFDLLPSSGCRAEPPAPN